MTFLTRVLKWLSLRRTRTKRPVAQQLYIANTKPCQQQTDVRWWEIQTEHGKYTITLIIHMMNSTTIDTCLNMSTA